jgi:outer membrane protein OmpA-like peptidoglycan-associated protein
VASKTVPPKAPDRSPTRPPWAPLVASAVLVPTVLAGLTLAWPRPAIESTLTGTANQALAAAGITGATVTFTGRDATIAGVPAGQRDKAVAAVEAATGVRVADAGGAGTGDGTGPGNGTGGGTGGGTGSGPAVSASPFGIARQGDTITLSGIVGSDDQKSQLVAAAKAAAGTATVVDQLTVTAGAPLPSGVTADSAGAVTKALAGAAGDISASIGANGVTLSGSVPDAAAKTAAAAAVTAALPGVTVDNQLAIAPAAGSGGSGSGGSGELGDAAKRALQSKITGLLQGSPISFGPDSPQLTAQGQATLARVLAAVKAEPAARLRIDGFVAPGRGNGKLTAQQLSDQRAAAVKDALTAGGVPADHLTAAGRGETTGAGAAARRVDITVV